MAEIIVTLTPIDSGNWEVPSGVTLLKIIRGWGSGANGGGGGDTGGLNPLGGDGGGGGAYAEINNLVVNPGDSIAVFIDPSNGEAATTAEYPGGNVVLIADSAFQSQNGTTAASLGTIKRRGGAGAVNTLAQSGSGGGGGAGTTGFGQNGGAATIGPPSIPGARGAGGTGSPAGGNGGTGGDSLSDGEAGFSPAGGGGGGSQFSRGGVGADGMLQIIYDEPVTGGTPPIVSGNSLSFLRRLNDAR